MNPTETAKTVSVRDMQNQHCEYDERGLTKI